MNKTGKWANDHDRLDEIRRQTHIAIAAKIDEDRSLLDLPKRNIHRWANQAGYMHGAYAEWLAFLDKPWPEIRSVLVADDEDAKRLRQSSPFTGILSPWERRAIRESVATVVHRHARVPPSRAGRPISESTGNP